MLRTISNMDTHKILNAILNEGASRHFYAHLRTGHVAFVPPMGGFSRSEGLIGVTVNSRKLNVTSEMATAQVSV